MSKMIGRTMRFEKGKYCNLHWMDITKEMTCIFGNIVEKAECSAINVETIRVITNQILRAEKTKFSYDGFTPNILISFKGGNTVNFNVSEWGNLRLIAPK